EQIESVGGKYVGIELGEAASAGGGYAKELSEADKARQQDLLAAQVAQSDVVITTALIPGRPAPRLIAADMVPGMRPGSVIVDMAVELNKYFPMLMTAAGMVPPAKVFVIGAAVAGLQAIATAKRLGANVVATDVRPEVKEQIESVGGKYVGIELGEAASAGGGYAKELSEADQARQRELLAAQVAQSDVVITTALIGGVFAPRLITAEMVRSMKPGAVIVDLAADGGGNCELSRPGETVRVGGVTILAPLNLAASLPLHASLLFSRNLTAFVLAFTRDKSFHLDFADDIQQGALITHDGEVKHARTRDALQKGAA
ncbi:MAG TPA: hypothetical protein VG500_15695, partial [Gemmatimonadales bacterium]|nr:hypothetical protein [Gemmatimonadales bacterium]